MVTPAGAIGAGFARAGSPVLTAAIRRAGWGRVVDVARLSITAGEYLFQPNNREVSTLTASFTAEINNSLSIYRRKLLFQTLCVDSSSDCGEFVDFNRSTVKDLSF
jgi:hypothetical protein